MSYSLSPLFPLQWALVSAEASPERPEDPVMPVGGILVGVQYKGPTLSPKRIHENHCGSYDDTGPRPATVPYVTPFTLGTMVERACKKKSHGKKVGHTQMSSPPPQMSSQMSFKCHMS